MDVLYGWLVLLYDNVVPFIRHIRRIFSGFIVLYVILSGQAYEKKLKSCGSYAWNKWGQVLCVKWGQSGLAL